MTELEKLKAAKEVWVKWFQGDNVVIGWTEWIESEIARLEDPHVKAKNIISKFAVSTMPWYLKDSEVKGIHDYVRHLESELAKRTVASEPLDPKRVLATAATLTEMLSVSDERKLSIRDALTWSVCDSAANPYEVKK